MKIEETKNGIFMLYNNYLNKLEKNERKVE